MPKLQILSPGSLAKTIELTKNLMTIGRTEDNDVHVQDDSVSKRHGILVRDGDDYQLHDFNSTNGTFVNGERIMAFKLKHGVSIRLGFVELQYESVPAKADIPAEGLMSQGKIRISEGGLQSASSKERGMSKRMKPDFAPGMLDTGPVTIRPKISAKPIPPAPPEPPKP